MELHRLWDGVLDIDLPLSDDDCSNDPVGESNLILPESIYHSHRPFVRQKYPFSLRLDCGISIAHSRHGHEWKALIAAAHGYPSRFTSPSPGAAAGETSEDRNFTARLTSQ